MAMLYREIACSTCGRMTLHEKQRVGLGTGLILLAITGGLFLPIWVILEARFAFTDYRCQHCGNPNPNRRSA